MTEAKRTWEKKIASLHNITNEELLSRHLETLKVIENNKSSIC